MTAFGKVSCDRGNSYVAVSFVHLPTGDRYYLQVHEHAHGQTMEWFYKAWVGLPSLRTTWEGVPLGGVEFALAHLAAYRLTGVELPA